MKNSLLQQALDELQEEQAEVKKQHGSSVQEIKNKHSMCTTDANQAWFTADANARIICAEMQVREELVQMQEEMQQQKTHSNSNAERSVNNEVAIRELEAENKEAGERMSAEMADLRAKLMSQHSEEEESHSLRLESAQWEHKALLVELKQQETEFGVRMSSLTSELAQ